MNDQASAALIDAIKVEDYKEREKAVQLWVTRWIVTAQQEVQVSDAHPRVVALELASATHRMVETMVLTGAQEKVIQVTPRKFDPNAASYLIEMMLIRYQVVPRPGVLGVVPAPPPRRKKKT